MRSSILTLAVLTIWACSSDSVESAADTSSDTADASTDSADAPDVQPDVADVEADTEPDTSDVDVSDVDVSDVGADSDAAPDVDASEPDVSNDPLEDPRRDSELDSDPDPSDVEPESDAEEPDIDAALEPSFEIGIGESEFRPAPEAAEAVMAQGIQGGFHIWGALRATGINPADVNYEARLRFEGELVGAVFATRTMDDVGDGVFETAGITIFIEFEVVPELADGQVWEYCATLTSSDGYTDSQCTTITATCCQYLDF